MITPSYANLAPNGLMTGQLVRLLIVLPRRMMTCAVCVSDYASRRIKSHHASSDLLANSFQDLNQTKYSDSEGSMLLPDASVNPENLRRKPCQISSDVTGNLCTNRQIKCDFRRLYRVRMPEISQSCCPPCQIIFCGR